MRLRAAGLVMLGTMVPGCSISEDYAKSQLEVDGYAEVSITGRTPDDGFAFRAKNAEGKTCTGTYLPKQSIGCQAAMTQANCE